MKTLKLKIKHSDLNISKELRVFNSVVRFSFNRFQEGLKEKEVRSLVNHLFAKEKLNCWLVQCAIKEGSALYVKHQDKNIVFGGKSLYRKYLKKEISKEEFKTLKQLPLTIQGEKQYKGNRLIDFKLNENELTLKFSRNNHQEIVLENTHKNLRKELTKLQELIDNKLVTVTVKLNNEFVWLTYDERLVNDSKFIGLKENRILGIDLNPNALGISIIEFDLQGNFEVIHKEVISAWKLNDKTVKSTKRKFELIQICHHIKNLVNVWKCGKVGIEELNIQSNNKGLGKNFNRLCNNVWCRDLVVNKLKMLSNLFGFEIVEVNPAYSSFVGNMLYGNSSTPDMVASSIEIGRRSYKKFIKDWFYPEFNVEALDEQWKQTLSGIENWKDAYSQIVKKLKLKYRFLLKDSVSDAVFSKYYKKLKVQLYTFN